MFLSLNLIRSSQHKTTRQEEEKKLSPEKDRRQQKLDELNTRIQQLQDSIAQQEDEIFRDFSKFALASSLHLLSLLVFPLMLSCLGITPLSDHSLRFGTMQCHHHITGA